MLDHPGKPAAPVTGFLLEAAICQSGRCCASSTDRLPAGRRKDRSAASRRARYEAPRVAPVRSSFASGQLLAATPAPAFAPAQAPGEGQTLTCLARKAGKIPWPRCPVRPRPRVWRGAGRWTQTGSRLGTACLRRDTRRRVLDPRFLNSISERSDDALTREPRLLAMERECQAGNEEGQEEDGEDALSAASEGDGFAVSGVEGLGSAGVSPVADLQGVTRRYYRLTPPGERRLADEAARLHANAVVAMSRLRPAGGLR